MEAIAIKKVNGIDVERLQETANSLKTNPSLGNFKFRSATKWLKGANSRTSIKGLFGLGKELNSRTKQFALECDEPAALGGTDKGPNPTETLLHALGSCLTTTMIYQATSKGYTLTKLASTCEGEIDLRGFLGLDPNVQKGYKRIRVTCTIDGNITREQKEQILKSGRQLSPVYEMVSKSVPIEITLN